jgi:ABC-type glycerol-3-phosphate transport system substrate-binding protein
VQAGEIFLRGDGIAALPVIVDPLVLYWNRTLFGNAAVAQPPKYWDDVAAITPQLTQKTANGSVTQSAIALGGWGNIAHGKEILITLMMQLGAPVVALDANNQYRASMSETLSNGLSPALSAVRYYADFADPVKPNYSWNRSQKNSRDAFLAGTLAMYVAPASELLSIREANPNLNFDVAPVPVSRGAGTGVAARVVGVAVPRGASNPAGAATVAVLLAGPAVQKTLADALHLPTARRDIEVDASADQYLTVFRASALRAFAFLDPNPPQSNLVFGRMVDNISSGRSTLSEAVRDAADELQQLLKVQ